MHCDSICTSGRPSLIGEAIGTSAIECLEWAFRPASKLSGFTASIRSGGLAVHRMFRSNVEREHVVRAHEYRSLPKRQHDGRSTRPHEDKARQAVMSKHPYQCRSESSHRRIDNMHGDVRGDRADLRLAAYDHYPGGLAREDFTRLACGDLRG